MTRPNRGTTSTGAGGSKPLSGPMHVLLRVAGVLAVVIGVVALLVPLLPTTPFLLLAAACFARSSDRFYNWLIGHRWFGSHIRNYREHHGTTKAVKVTSIAMIWCSIIFSSVFVVSSWPLRSVLALIAIGVTIHLLRLKTVPCPAGAESKSAVPTQDR